MSYEVLTLIVADLAAAAVLAFGLYFRRHFRRDLVVAFFGINIGVFAVSAVLAESQVGAGVGLGLFGVLSIIRLRSDELAQHEIAYYFAMLALGLIGGLNAAPLPYSLLFMALIVVTIALIDHPGLLRGHQRQQVVLDRAIGDPQELREHLRELLGAEISAVSITRLDLVNDTTTVDVRFRRGTGAGTSAGARRVAGRIAERITGKDSAQRAPHAAPAHPAAGPRAPQEEGVLTGAAR